MATTDRTISSFDARSRTILTNGGTVKGGNGITYRYDPNTGMAVNVNASTAAPVTSVAPRATTNTPRPVEAEDTRRGVQTPAERADLGSRVEYVPGSPNAVAGNSSTPEAVAGDALKDLVDPDQARIDAANKLRQNDARARILSVLAEYGLESLADFVWQQILGGKSDAEVLQDIRNTPEFRERFPAIAERTAKKLAPISPGEYVAYERQARQIMRAAGLPEQFYDTRDDFTKFLGRDVSIAELNDRIQLGKQAVYESPAEVRETLMRDYGATEGELTAYFIDPDRALPLVEKQWRAAQVGGAAKRTGFGLTSRMENERLADMGVTAGQAQQGFSELADSRELFGALDSGEENIGRDDQLDATFGGNAAARRRIENTRRRRQARFDGGGSFATGQQGVVGLGRNSQV